MIRTLLPQIPGLLRAAGPCLVILAFSWGFAVEHAKAGGIYRASECSPGHRDTPDATVEGAATPYAASTSCAGGNWLQVQSAAAASPGMARQWVYTAPPGTRINQFEAGYNLVGAPAPDGNRSYLFIRRHGESANENISAVGLGSVAGTYDSAIQDLGPFAALGVGLFCSKSSGTCGYAPGQFARISNVSFLMEDLTPPGSPIVAGDAADGKWVGETTQVAVGETDVGAGVYRTTVEVGDQTVADDVICEPGQDAAGHVGSMAPCDPIELRFIPVDTTAAPFADGSANDVRVCTHEFGLAAARTCTVKSFRVDNIAPDAPQQLEVAGGDGWRRDNDFDLSWVNPPGQKAPIEAATVKVTGTGGYASTETRTGTNIDSFDNVTVPGVGSYTAEVFLRDEAGNESPQASAATSLKFDDTAPAKSQPEIANGWISRAELTAGYSQGWQRPRDQELPPSGVAGYRVVVNDSRDHDPCAGPGDGRGCAGPLTEIGLDSNSRVLGLDDLVEGLNWVHVVPVSGSGVRAPEVGRVPLKVDLTDPSTELIGAPGGWVNHPLNLEARSHDALSGMEDTDEFPDDDPPMTALSVDGSELSDSDADVTVPVAAEGVHRVEYWARDLAGNANDGIGGNAAVGTAEVKVDVTPPELAFTNRQDPDDPDRLEAPVADALSGVVDGRISFRAAGASGWAPLATNLRDGRLIARVDSEDLKPETRYEFRAEATDRAGNTAASSRRLDGSTMSTVGPFRATAAFTGLAINGKRRTKAGYRRPITVSGRLTETTGAPIAHAHVDLSEAYAAGSRPLSRSVSVVTDRSGRFAARMPKGPSRSVVARFAGDSRRLAASSGRASVRVKSAISLRAPKRLRAGARAAFSGRVKARGAHFSRGGKSVEVQVRIGRRWKTVGRSLRTDSKGRYRLRYRFVAEYTRPVRYRFRAVALRERGWPYLPATSRVRRLVVRP